MGRKLNLVFYVRDEETKRLLFEPKQIALTISLAGIEKAQAIVGLKREWERLHVALPKNATKEQNEEAIAAFQAWHGAVDELTGICAAAGETVSRFCRMQIEEHLNKVKEPI